MSDLKSSKKQKPYAGKIDISGLFELADENAPSADNSSAPKPLIRVEQIHRKPEQVRRYFDPQKMEQLTLLSQGSRHSGKPNRASATRKGRGVRASSR
jgi:hypothetical protein